MRYAVAAGLVAGALLALPSRRDGGGTCNYDCRIEGGGRIAIDQWAGIIAASGFEHQPSVWGTASSIRRNGGSTSGEDGRLDLDDLPCEEPARRLRSLVQRATSPAAVPSSPATTSYGEPTAGLHDALRRPRTTPSCSRASGWTRRFGRTPTARRMPPGCQYAQPSYATERCNRSTAGCDKRRIEPIVINRSASN